MSKHNDLENAILALIFNGTTIPNIADDTATSAATTLTVALHTGDPGETGDMTTSEVAYTNYARQTVARSSGGWTVSGNSVSPVADIDFPEAGAGASGTVTHFSVGTGVSDNILYSGTLTPNIILNEGVIPRVSSATTVTED